MKDFKIEIIALDDEKVDVLQPAENTFWGCTCCSLDINPEEEEEEE